MASSFELKNRRGLPHKNPFRTDEICVDDLYIKPVEASNPSTTRTLALVMATGARDCLERLLREEDPVLLRDLAETQLDLLNRFLEP
jgi:hypothetical protein